MTLQELEQVIQWAKEGRLQYHYAAGWRDDNDNPSISSRDSFSDYRRKPEPKLRPWKPEEVPVGALIRWKPEVKAFFTGQRGFDIAIIIGIHCSRILTGQAGCNFRLETMLKNHEHSFDHGKTWLPCGVVEE